MDTKVTMMTTGGIPMGTWPTTSLHRGGMVETTTTYATLSTVEMHAARSKAGTKIGSVTSKNNAMRGTVITMAPTMTSITRNILLK
jgi:hypothetical protein